MSDSDIYWTFVTASKYGGSFYQQLGNAGLAADPINKRLGILNTWPMMVAPPMAPPAGCIVIAAHTGYGQALAA
jgi:hypothetical protein